MDELAVAAAVATTTVDAKAGGEMGQRGACVTYGADDAAMPNVEATSEDKENDDAHAALGKPEDARSKV